MSQKIAVSCYAIFGKNCTEGIFPSPPLTWKRLDSDTGRVHLRVGSGRVGSGRVQIFSYLLGRVGSGPFVWVCVGHLDYTKCYAKCNCKLYTVTDSGLSAYEQCR